jgi:hypothetical protein
MTEMKGVAAFVIKSHPGLKKEANVNISSISY